MAADEAPRNAQSEAISRRRLLGGLATALPVSAQKPVAGRPNLVFLFSDQQSSDMLRCYGNTQIITPNIDCLAQEGVRFKRCISNSPVCTPYRGVLLSGQHPLWTGALGNDLQMVPGNGKYFGEILRDAGYRMGYFGKWHLYGGDRVRPIPAGAYRYGFDGTFLSNNCTLLYDKDRAYYWDEKGRRQLYGDWEPFAQTRHAMQFIDEGSKAAPFALFLSWHPPHNWQGAERYPAPEELLRAYNPEKIKVRGNCENTAERREAYRGHMAMCTSIDTCVGWLTKKLEDAGLADNTILVYTSDHGDLLLSHGLRGNKGRAENESIHVPLIIRWPKRLKTRVSDMPVGTLDLMPTLLSMLDIEPPETCQGRDLGSAIIQEQDVRTESLPLFLMVHDWRGVYTDRYTYSFSVPTKNPSWWNQVAGHDSETHNRLFDREADPLEMRNLFYDSAHSKLKDKLHQQALDWMARFRDEGLSYPDIVSRLESADDLAADREKRLSRNGTGRLRGRPIDFL
jgi:arylsulfatase A-like enzyme